MPHPSVQKKKTEHIRAKFQRVYANILMIEGLLDQIDRGRDDPECWRAADKLLLDMVSILNSVAEEFESHYTEEPDPPHVEKSVHSIKTGPGPGA